MCSFRSSGTPVPLSEIVICSGRLSDFPREVRTFNQGLTSQESGFVAPPLTSYGTHIFPAGPAAMFLVLAFVAVTHQGRTRTWDAVAAIAIIALPWLSVKYVPHAAVMAAGLAWKHRDARRRLVELGAVFAAAGISYLALHRGIYGGWTVYAAGDHFVGGELEVIGRRPRPLPRTRRLIGLLVDTHGAAPSHPARGI